LANIFFKRLTKLVLLKTRSFMLNLTNLLMLLLVIIIGLAFWSKAATKNKRLLHSTAILSGIAIVIYFNNVSALAGTDSVSPGAGAINSFVTEEQQSFQEDLNLTLDGGHDSGIEYADRIKEAGEAEEAEGAGASRK
jgi:hypothetical protein